MDYSRSRTDPSESGIKTPAPTILSLDNGQHTPSFDEKTDEPEYIHGLALVTSLLALTLAIFLMLLDTSIVSTAIPQITTNFHSLNDVGWYGTAYLMAVCSVQPLSGKMYTYFNSKWTFLTFFTIFELGSAICGAASSSYMLIVGRAIAGIGSSGLLNGAFTILHASFPAQRLPTLTGILMGITQLGSLSGPLIGGALTQHASWRWCFYINLPCAAAIYPALFLIHIPDGRTATSKSQPITASLRYLDIPGFILFAGTMIQLLCALNWGGTSYLWHSPTIIGLFCGTGGTFLVFLLWEYHKGIHALIPLELVKKRAIWSSCLNYAFMIGSAMCFTYYLPMYFQAVRDASPTKSGVDLLPAIVTTIVFAMLSGVLVGKLGYYLPFAVASGAMTTIGAGLFTTLTPTTATRNWVGFQLLQGTGRGLGVQMPLIAVQTAAPREMHSVATGLVVLAQNVGPAIFLGICQVVFSGGLKSALARYAPGVDSRVVEAAGARGLRDVLGPTLEGCEEVLMGVLKAYNAAVVDVFYVSLAAAGAALVFAFGMGWVSVKSKNEDGEKSL